MTHIILINRHINRHISSRSAYGALRLLSIIVVASSLASCPRPVPRAHRRTAVAKPAPAVVQDNRRYRVRLFRPLKVGVRYRAEVRGHVDTEASFDRKSFPPRTSRWSYCLLADVTVKEVHSSGFSSREELRIRKLQSSTSGAMVDLLPAGTVVQGHVAGGKEIYSVDGKPVNATAMKVLRFSMNLYKGDPTTADDIFGVSEPKRVGESWPPDRKMLLKRLRKSIKSSAIWPKPEDLVGKVTLVGARRIKGLDMLEYKVEARVKNIAPKLHRIKMRSGTLIISISGQVPQDPRLAATYHMNMNLVMNVEGELGAGGNVAKMMLGIVQAQQSTSTLLE